MLLIKPDIFSLIIQDGANVGENLVTFERALILKNEFSLRLGIHAASIRRKVSTLVIWG